MPTIPTHIAEAASRLKANAYYSSWSLEANAMDRDADRATLASFALSIIATGEEAITEEWLRSKFEEKVFLERFLASVKRNPSPARGTGALDFVSKACPNKAEFVGRDEAGNYIDKTVDAMWFGFKLAAALSIELKPRDRRGEEG